MNNTNRVNAAANPQPYSVFLYSLFWTLGQTWCVRSLFVCSIKRVASSSRGKKVTERTCDSVVWAEWNHTAPFVVLCNKLASYRMVDLRNRADPSKVFPATRLSYSRCITNPFVVAPAAPLSYTFAFLSCSKLTETDWLRCALIAKKQRSSQKKKKKKRKGEQQSRAEVEKWSDTKAETDATVVNKFIHFHFRWSSNNTSASAHVMDQNRLVREDCGHSQLKALTIKSSFFVNNKTSVLMCLYS